MEFRRRQSMEAWRAGSDDLALPELAPLASELERDPALREECDALHDEQHLVRSALHDIPVPAGLAARLIQSLRSAPPAALDDVEVVGPAAPSADAPAPMVASSPLVDSTPSERGPSQFRFLLGIGGLAAILLIAGLSMHWFAPPPMSHESLVAAALDLPASEVLRGDQWRGDLEAAPVEAAFPAKAFRLDVTPIGWRDARDMVPGASGAIYRLAGPRHAQTYLLVLEVPGGVTGLDVSPAIDAMRSTGGWVAGAWRDGDRVCLLLVEGTTDRLRSLLRPETVAA